MTRFSSTLWTTLWPGVHTAGKCQVWDRSLRGHGPLFSWFLVSLSWELLLELLVRKYIVYNVFTIWIVKENCVSKRSQKSQILKSNKFWHASVSSSIQFLDSKFDPYSFYFSWYCINCLGEGRNVCCVCWSISGEDKLFFKGNEALPTLSDYLVFNTIKW